VYDAGAMVKPLLLLLAALLGMGCSNVATAVPADQKSIARDSGVVIGRLGFVSRTKITLQSFQVAAVQVPDGARYWIQARLGGAAEESGSFFINLPAGHYRLTEWSASSSDAEFAGEDLGLAIEVLRGQAVCVGAVYVHPRPKQILRLERDEAPPPVVRDECEALNEILGRHRPELSQAAVSRVARPVGARRRGS
jgi:hypothetical protein